MSMVDDLPTDLDIVTQELHQWIDKWSPAIQKWLAVNRTEHAEFARIIEQVPQLLRLLVNLIKDPSVPAETKKFLYSTVNYVFDGDDRISENQIGVVGLVDDSFKMAVLVQQLVGRYTHLIRNNWSGTGEVLDLIEFIQDKGKKYQPTDEVDKGEETEPVAEDIAASLEAARAAAEVTRPSNNPLDEAGVNPAAVTRPNERTKLITDKPIDEPDAD